MNGWFGANDSVLIEVLVGRTEKDMGIIKTAYVAKYGKEIEDDVRENLTGDFRSLFLAVLSVSFYFTIYLFFNYYYYYYYYY